MSKGIKSRQRSYNVSVIQHIWKSIFKQKDKVNEGKKQLLSKTDMHELTQMNINSFI